jgi:NADH dehydrogenase
VSGLEEDARDEAARPRVVVVGGGFAGLNVVRGLRDVAVDVTLIDRRNFHLFQPLLYQVATGALNPGDIGQPLRQILRRQRNATVLLGNVVAIHADAQEVGLSDGARIPYDMLVVSSGVTHSYFGHDDWAARAPGLKTIEDALEIRRRILVAFEAAEREADDAARQEWMRFVIVGGGPTGVELAGAIADIANRTLRRDFRRIDPTRAEILLLEGLDRILPTYPEDLSSSARRQLEGLGATVRTGTMVTDIDETTVTVLCGESTERLGARTVLWAAGVRASRFGSALAASVGAETDKAGRVIVQPDLTLPGRPEIFVVGDLAVVRGEGTAPLPGVAQVAIQSGKYVARHLENRLWGERTKLFEYRDPGNMATIGRSAAVADLGRIHLSGFLAWSAWLFVHILYLVGFENRVLVVTQWAWNFFTGERGTRLITGPQARLVPPLEAPDT